MNDNFAEAGEAPVFALHLPDTIEAHRNNRQREIFRQQADTGLKWSHAAVSGIIDFTFRKNQHGITTIGGFAGEAEALPETGKLRQWKNVKEGGDQEIAELISPSFCKKPVARRSAHALERLAAHRGSEAVTETRRKRGQDQSDIRAASDVIGDDDGRALKILQVVAAEYARVSEQLGGRPSQRVVNKKTREADRFALSPAGVVILVSGR